MLRRTDYLEEYLSFWNALAEVVRMWVSLYSPQENETCAEMLSMSDRVAVAEELRTLQPRYPKLLMNSGIARALQSPPTTPSECMFARMSTNYSADLQTRVEPCIFGGTPDCSQCGCAISAGLHWLKTVRVARLVKIETLVNGSVGLGSALGKLRREYQPHPRWIVQPGSESKLVQIAGRERQI
jgi:hypothetical protein